MRNESVRFKFHSLYERILYFYLFSGFTARNMLTAYMKYWTRPILNNAHRSITIYFIFRGIEREGERDREGGRERESKREKERKQAFFQCFSLHFSTEIVHRNFYIVQQLFVIRFAFFSLDSDSVFVRFSPFFFSRETIRCMWTKFESIAFLCMWTNVWSYSISLS